MWGEKEEEASDTDNINYRGSTGEEPETRSILGLQQPSAFRTVPGLLDVGESKGRNRGQTAGFGDILIFEQPVQTVSVP